MQIFRLRSPQATASLTPPRWTWTSRPRWTSSSSTTPNSSTKTRSWANWSMASGPSSRWGPEGKRASSRESTRRWGTWWCSWRRSRTSTNQNSSACWGRYRDCTERRTSWRWTRASSWKNSKRRTSGRWCSRWHRWNGRKMKRKLSWNCKYQSWKKHWSWRILRRKAWKPKWSQKINNSARKTHCFRTNSNINANWKTWNWMRLFEGEKTICVLHSNTYNWRKMLRWDNWKTVFWSWGRRWLTRTWKSNNFPRRTQGKMRKFTLNCPRSRQTSRLFWKRSKPWLSQVSTK